MRTTDCPICGGTSAPLLTMHFGRKLSLPTEILVRHCATDNFAFVANVRQDDYDEYYAGVANDTCHQEVSSGLVRSPISQLQAQHLASALAGFFDQPRKVLDFGCGGASLLLELASAFPGSQFWGFDPGPAAKAGAERARALGLKNLTIAGLAECRGAGTYDLVIASHVLEHIIDFDLVELLKSLLAENGFLYVEVPHTLHYAAHPRLEFLYYFDRLHVNHFTPTALARLAGNCGFGYACHFAYAFPYRDQGTYPALGMLFRKSAQPVAVPSDDVGEACQAYIHQEKVRARGQADILNGFDGVLVWGAGDNFYRSVENGGPLSDVHQMVVLDRRSQEINVRDNVQKTVDPEAGIRAHDWPVVITISEARPEIAKRVQAIDPERRVLFL